MAIRGPSTLKKPVRRCLFGPPDHAKIRRDLDRALSEMDRSTSEELKSKWGFDTLTETGVPEGRYEYTEVKDSEYVPSFYRKAYTTKSKRCIDSDSSDTVAASSHMDLTTSTSMVSTVTTSTQAGNGLASSQNTRRVITGVRRLNFKENCDRPVSSTSNSSRSRVSSRASPHQSTMPEHFQSRKRRALEFETNLPRSKSPRL